MRSRKACKNYMADTHEETMPSFIISLSCIFEEFNLMWELPKIDYKNLLQFEIHEILSFTEKLQLWGQNGGYMGDR